MSLDERFAAALSQADRFWSKVRFAHGDTCWEWTGAKDKDGYGKFQVSLPRLEVGRQRQWAVRSHRLALMLSGVSVPVGTLVLHDCDNPPCCRPIHLKPGTQQQNRSDAVERNRVAAGERHGMAKLTEDRARELIRMRSAGIPIGRIAAEFGIALSTAYQVGTLYWRHLSP